MSVKGLVLKNGKPEFCKVNIKLDVKEGHVLVKNIAFGINYSDLAIYRKQISPSNEHNIFGTESAGIVEEVGKNCIRGFKKGDRVFYCFFNNASMVTYKVVNEKDLCIIEDHIQTELAAGCYFKLLACHMLAFSVYRAAADQTVIVSQGGIGYMLTQFLTSMNIKVIAAVGNDAKKEFALHCGASHVINYYSKDFAKEAQEYAGDKGIAAVYDGIGKDLAPIAIKALRPCGIIISYGSASGEVKIDQGSLFEKSLFFTSPNIYTYRSYYMDLSTAIKHMIEYLKKKSIRPHFKSHNILSAETVFQRMDQRRTIGNHLFTL